ncbi:MAG: trehalose-phosphatase [Xanthobacteraceae bacterium]
MVELGENERNCALFLDIDGTLIDVAAAPDCVIVPMELPPLLARLAASLDGALAIVTGRPILDVDRFLAPQRFIVAGVHGAELRLAPDGAIQSRAEPLDPALIAAIAQLVQLDPGVIVELKQFSIAVHYRMAPAARLRIAAELQKILDSGPDHLILCKGRAVFEVVPKHISKGGAIDVLLQLPVFRGRRPIMIGDDISDLSAFEAVVRHGGLALRVAGEHFPRDMAEFDGPAHVRTWLSDLAKRLEE